MTCCATPRPPFTISMTNVPALCAARAASRNLELLDLQPGEFVTDLTLMQGNNRIKVGDLGTRARNQSTPKSGEGLDSQQIGPDVSGSLMVGVNGQVAGLIHFRRSDRLVATAALRRLCTKRNLHIGIISDQPPGRTPCASLGRRFSDRRLVAR